MGFAFLESYWYEEKPGLRRCPRCSSARGAIFVQYSLNVNQPQVLKEPVCRRCDKSWCEKTYPPIVWEHPDQRRRKPPVATRTLARQKKSKSKRP